MDENLTDTIEKYDYVKTQLSYYKNYIQYALNDLNKIIPLLESNSDSVCVSSYLKELKAIRENLLLNKDRIIYTLMPEIDIKLAKIILQI